MPKRSKHVPFRMCVACRTTGDKRVLLRVVRTQDGAAAYDGSGKAHGRGAYVCADLECIALSERRGALAKHLKAVVPGDVLDLLRSAARPPDPPTEP